MTGHHTSWHQVQQGFDLSLQSVSSRSGDYKNGSPTSDDRSHWRGSYNNNRNNTNVAFDGKQRRPSTERYRGT